MSRRYTISLLLRIGSQVCLYSLKKDFLLEVCQAFILFAFRAPRSCSLTGLIPMPYSCFAKLAVSRTGSNYFGKGAKCALLMAVYPVTFSMPETYYMLRKCLLNKWGRLWVARIGLDAHEGGAGKRSQLEYRISFRSINRISVATGAVPAPLTRAQLWEDVICYQLLDGQIFNLLVQLVLLCVFWRYFIRCRYIFYLYML